MLIMISIPAINRADKVTFFFMVQKFELNGFDRQFSEKDSDCADGKEIDQVLWIKHTAFDGIKVVVDAKRIEHHPKPVVPLESIYRKWIETDADHQCQDKSYNLIIGDGICKQAYPDVRWTQEYQPQVTAFLSVAQIINILNLLTVR